MHLYTIKVLLFWLLFACFVTEIFAKSQDKKKKETSGKTIKEKVEVNIQVTHKTPLPKSTKLRLTLPTLNTIKKKNAPPESQETPEIKHTLPTQKVKQTKETTVVMKTPKTVVITKLTTYIKDEEHTVVTKPTKTNQITTKILTLRPTPVITKYTKATEPATIKGTKAHNQITTILTTQKITEMKTKTVTMQTEKPTTTTRAKTTTGKKKEMHTLKPNNEKIQNENRQQPLKDNRFVRQRMETHNPHILQKPMQQFFQNRFTYTTLPHELHTHHKKHHNHHHHHHHHKHRSHHRRHSTDRIGNEVNMETDNNRIHTFNNNNNGMFNNGYKPIRTMDQNYVMGRSPKENMNNKNFNPAESVNKFNQQKFQNLDATNNIGVPRNGDEHHKKSHHHHHHKHHEHHKHKHHEMRNDINVGRNFYSQRPQVEKIVTQKLVEKTVAPPINKMKTKPFVKPSEINTITKSKSVTLGKKPMEEHTMKPAPVIKTQIQNILTTEKSDINESKEKKKPDGSFSLKGISKHLMNNIYDNTLGRFLKKKTTSKENHKKESCDTCNLHNTILENQQGFTTPVSLKMQTNLRSEMSMSKKIQTPNVIPSKGTSKINLLVTTPNVPYITTKLPLTVTKILSTISSTTLGCGISTSLSNTVTQLPVSKTFPTKDVGLASTIKPRQSTIFSALLSKTTIKSITLKETQRPDIVDKKDLTANKIINITHYGDVEDLHEDQLQKPLKLCITENPSHDHQEVTSGTFRNTLTDLPKMKATTITLYGNYCIRTEKDYTTQNNVSVINHDKSHHDLTTEHVVAETLKTNDNDRVHGRHNELTTNHYDVEHNQVHVVNFTDSVFKPNEYYDNHTDVHDTPVDVYHVENVTNTVTTDSNIHINNDATTTPHNDINPTTTHYSGTSELITTAVTTESTTEYQTPSTTTDMQTSSTTESYYARRQRHRTTTEYNPYYSRTTTDYYGRTSTSYGGYYANRWRRSTTEETTTESTTMAYSTPSTTENSYTTPTTTDMTATQSLDVRTTEKITDNDEGINENERLELKENLNDGDHSAEVRKRKKKSKRRHHSRHHVSQSASVEETPNHVEENAEVRKISKIQKALSFIYNSWIMQKVIDTFKSVTQYICTRLKSTVWRVVHKKISKHFDEDNKGVEKVEEEEEEDHQLHEDEDNDAVANAETREIGKNDLHGNEETGLQDTEVVVRSHQTHESLSGKADYEPTYF